MKDKSFKTTLRYFTIAEWEKEQEYLRREHNKGWKFTGVTLPGFYHFEKCQPKMWSISWIIILKVSITKKNMYRCFKTAAGNMLQILSATATSARLSHRCTGMKKSFAIHNHGWI